MPAVSAVEDGHCPWSISASSTWAKLAAGTLLQSAEPARP